ncbi:MAG: hypothetical protein HRU50_08175 [Winogradskyella sp.]|uniref:hypothetical protein n=1 Tax=Winogradskyella sp. TaxID=1883156 RepID=UPI0025E547C8|nr:hypothetical protein [Winogradskyella sp.]NRB59893.1 hypothetical protein [Winogradskyella sp.]
MKKAVVIILFLTMSLAGFAQQNNEVALNNDTELVETIKEETVATAKVSVSAKMKAKVLKINRKKSNEIISIKAYRKSLQIKVKTVKLC